MKLKYPLTLYIFNTLNFFLYLIRYKTKLNVYFLRINNLIYKLCLLIIITKSSLVRCGQISLDRILRLLTKTDSAETSPTTPTTRPPKQFGIWPDFNRFLLESNNVPQASQTIGSFSAR